MGEINISLIKTASKLQTRAETVNMFVVDEYAEAMKNGQAFPPVECVFDGSDYWLWDGYHRTEAAKKAELNTISANITNGTIQDAEWLALTANKSHGIRRSNADKRRTVELALSHPNTVKLSDNQIAEHCGVSQPFVSKIRATYNGYKSDYRNGKDGRTIKIANIGKSSSEKLSTQAIKLLRFTSIPEDKREVAKLSRLPEENQIMIAEKIAEGSKNIETARVEIKREAYQHNGRNVVLPDSLTMIHADFREYAESVKDNSIDLIFTDPPYGEAGLHLWEVLARESARILKPNGLLISYCGNLMLDKIFSSMTPYLEFYYLASVRHSKAKRMFAHKAMNMAKPILIWIQKGGQPQHDWFMDLIHYKLENDMKDLHDWSQPLEEAAYLIQRFCPRCGVLLDPFMGAGTIPIAAARLGVKAVGIEIDEDYYLRAKARAMSRQKENPAGNRANLEDGEMD